ncbi:MAG TPA: adenylosuccinate synthase [Polyangia bacterium]
MPITIAVGTQWGDEGKGRVVDLLSDTADLVARFNGGDNAGHTVTVGPTTFKLHLVPSGIIHPQTVCLMGNGMVINPLSFLSEIEALTAAGVDASPARLFVSQAAHLITPAHRLLDQAQEAARGAGRIGTTGRGIGPAYVDKTARSGLRAGDILDQAGLPARVKEHVEQADRLIRQLYQGEGIDVAAISADFVEKARRMAPYIADVGAIARKNLAAGKYLLAEGAQGALLDLDQGTYPFVTSSCTTATGLFGGLGIGIQLVQRVVGITKAFQTRVGDGPFPTELKDEMALRLRGTGANPWDEYGPTTGRPRRVGWLDGVLLRYVVEISGITELAVTKLDILSGLPALKICTAYTLNGKPNSEFAVARLGEYQPVYENLPGWSEDVSGARRMSDLPPAARAYLHRLEELAGVPVSLVSVGAERDQVIRI